MVNCKVGMNKGKQELFAMVVMETAEAAALCISLLHKSPYNGNTLQVKKVSWQRQGWLQRFHISAESESSCTEQLYKINENINNERKQKCKMFTSSEIIICMKIVM